MNRAQRRELQRQVAKIAKGTFRLKHPAPDSVTLKGGPMDGWVVAPNAPALDADWRDTWLAEQAHNEYDTIAARRKRDQPGLELPTWDELTDAERNVFHQRVREVYGAGRYERKAGTVPAEARWIPS
jgi:hypothetical protein